MASESAIRWEIIRGINQRMVSDFFRAVFFSESELSLDGVVQSIIDGVVDDEARSLEEFAKAHMDEFVAYIKGVTGDGSVADASSKSMVLAFIEECGLYGDYHSFCAESARLWREPRDTVRDSIVESRLVPIFDGLQTNSVYIYRDSDQCGIHLVRYLLES